MTIKLRVVEADGLSSERTFQGNSISIGRDPESEIAVQPTQYRFVSWNHARIEYECERLVLRDLKSSNGTYLNGVRIARLAKLKLGDTIQLGRGGPKYVVLEYSLASNAEHEQAREVPTPYAEAIREAPTKVACSCSSCGAVFDVAREFVGRKTYCPLCSASMDVAAQNESNHHLRKDQPISLPAVDVQGVPAKQEDEAERGFDAVQDRHRERLAGRLSQWNMSGLSVLRLYMRANQRWRMFAVLVGMSLGVVLVALICVTIVARGRGFEGPPQESPLTSDKLRASRDQAAAEFDVQPSALPGGRNASASGLANRGASIQPSGTGDNVPRTSVPSDTAHALSETPTVASVPASPARPASAQPWSELFDRVRDSVLLVGIEEPKGRSSWPFATCCAIRDDTLVSSARVAYELARFRKSGWKIWVGRPWQGVREEVLEIRVHKLYQDTIQEPDKWVYFNVALLTTKGKLTKWAEMAASEDLEELASGMPVACVAINHDGEAINRFQTLSPELTAGKIFLVTTLPPAPGGPRLLHLQMPGSAMAYGSPLLNARGKVIGVYGEAAAMSKNQATKGLKIHYGTVLEPDLVKMRRQGQGDQFWVEPSVPQDPGTSGAKE